ncbi:hypothetical protein HWV62_34577, partial [Athelia sp. TMB]
LTCCRLPQARTAKRTTLTWTDFSSSGFSRTDAPLSSSLQFSTTLPPPSSLPAASLEMHKKLNKTVKKLPPFGWDTTPVVGQEEVIEEAFVDVFCDLVYGGGWMDVERGEEIGRECNWALVSQCFFLFNTFCSSAAGSQVEFKSLPVKALTAPGGSDPRTSTTLMLFEEFVPLEYRQQLDIVNNSSTSKSRLPSLFSPSNKNKSGKGWKPAATLNGRPYVVGHVPRSPSYREVEFEGLLRGNASATKVISLSTPTANNAGSKLAPPVTPERAGTPRPPPSPEQQPMTPARPTKSRGEDDAEPGTPHSTSKRMSRFRMPVPLPSPGSGRRSGLPPAEYSTVDFETRLTGASDDESGGDTIGSSQDRLRQEKRQSRDDAWVDILVATHNRRMGSQESEQPGTRRDRVRGLKGGRSDPELASMEVAQALAGVRALSPPSDDEFGKRGADTLAYRDSDYEPNGGTEEIEPMEEGGLEEQQEGEDEEVTSIMSHPRRRMVGYFDLHPERRPLARKSEEDEEDPRARLAQSDESHEENGERPHVPAIDIPNFANTEEEHRQQEIGHSRPESTTLPDIIVPPQRTTSKTAALIEMYREKEREGNSPVSPNSKLPLRSKSKESLPLPPALPVKALTPPPASPTPLAAEIDEEPEPELASELVPPIVDLESGRDSPGRYIHGAPLHNVLEEEEED